MATSDKLTTIAENVQKVYDAGAQSEYDKFWDNFQDYGKRTDYTYAFYGGYNVNYWGNIFNPKYSFNKITKASHMFCYFNKSIDLVSFLEERGLSMDLTNLIDGVDIFSSTKLTRVPAIKTSGQLQFTYAYSKFLETIDSLESTFDTTKNKIQFSNIFVSCSKLKNVAFKGTISGTGLNLQWSPLLTHDSLLSIINALADKSTDTSGTVWKVIIGPTNMAKLTTEDLNIIETKGWVFE